MKFICRKNTDVTVKKCIKQLTKHDSRLRLLRLGKAHERLNGFNNKKVTITTKILTLMT